MFEYNANESKLSATSPMPNANVYQYCISSYDEEGKWYNVVVTEDSGL